jgi:hypothetical protein
MARLSDRIRRLEALIEPETVAVELVGHDHTGVELWRTVWHVSPARARRIPERFTLAIGPPGHAEDETL